MSAAERAELFQSPGSGPADLTDRRAEIEDLRARVARLESLLDTAPPKKKRRRTTPEAPPPSSMRALARRLSAEV